MTGKMPGTLPGVDLGDLPQMFHFESHMRAGASFHSHTFFRLKFEFEYGDKQGGAILILESLRGSMSVAMDL
jgi:hypothetical protein